MASKRELIFPGSGDFIINEALCPVKIDLKQKLGTYIEPNLWIIHDLWNDIKSRKRKLVNQCKNSFKNDW